MAEKSAPSSQPDPGRSPSPKQLAAQARAESEAAEKRRERTIRIVGGVVVLVVVGALLALGFFAGQSKDQPATAPSADAGAAIPKSVQPDTYGVPVGTGWTASNAAKLPTLEIWEDFQCPACRQVEQMAGAAIIGMANEGKVKLLMRPTTFLDKNLPQSNNSSARATAAWGCAIDAGKAEEFHSTVFANQPATEGTGYTQDQLLEMGKAIGLTGAEFDTYSKCVTDGTYMGWAANSTQKFSESGATGTPTGYLNGTELTGSDLVDTAALAKKIEAATQS
jgi:protein-disulfide isomerase